RRKILMRLTTYLKPHVGAAVYMVALTAGVAVMEMIPIYLTTKVLIDDLLKGGGVTTITLIPGLWTVNVESWGLGVFTWLAILISVIVCVRVTMVAFSVLQSRISVMLGLSVTRDLRSTVYQHLQRLSVSFHDKMRVGTLMSRVLTDVSRVNGFLVSGVPHMGVVLLRLIAIGALLFLMNPFLAACILIPIPLVIYFSRLFYRRMGGLFHRQAQRYSLMSATINDAMNGVRVVKAFGQEDRELEKFGGRNEDWYSAGLKAEQSFFTFYPFIGFLMTSGAFIVYYFGGLDVVAGTMTLGTLLAFVAYLIQFYQPVQWLSRINDWITRDLTAAERIFEVLDTAPEVADHPKALAVDKLEGTVRFENVAFGYDPLEPVLQNVDVEVKQGEMVGLVGRSGAGKSTLINLVCRFYDPQEGRITIDGTDLREIKLDEWHSRLGIVPQESFLFHGTISENIAYAHPEATREDVIRAARAANAHNFISRFPDGYDGVVGERGTRLSGGERQRIAIARAILHDPKVLILDEATSSVDTETEQRIQEALRNLVKDRTVFAIAHRLSTLKFANRLIVIDDGKVAEFGTHDELIEKQGIYYGLVAAQTEMSKITAVGG
ncbi:MAG: ABC transporter ATP-binding protein, partial [Candidatus Latescibacteria bacterium]|nr:ABC transporter ATP-binding protein [Candidatus Latescibacterota bacterium]